MKAFYDEALRIAFKQCYDFQPVSIDWASRPHGMVVSKTKHSKTKTKARSTQISKTKHPKLENEAPKSGKRSTQSSKTKHPNLENEAPQTRKRSTQNSKPVCPLQHETDQEWENRKH